MMTTAQPEAKPAEGRLSAALAGHHVEGAWVFGVVTKRTYFVTEDRCHVHPEQQPLVEEPIFNADLSGLEHDSDLVLQRAQADIVVLGHAYPHPRRFAFTASVTVEEFVREIAVLGDRTLERGRDGVLSFTPPRSFDKMPLSWERAYGGADEIALREIGDPIAEISTPEGETPDPRFGLFGYPRNPLGRGYVIEAHRDAIAACRLPNLEDPRQRLAPETIVRQDFMLWPRGPIVAGLGWLGYRSFPRSAMLGIPVRPYNNGELVPKDFFEVAAGLVKPASVGLQNEFNERLDPRCAQGSAIGMRHHEIDPAAKVELVNLHPRHARWRFRLPREVPRIAFKLPDAPAANLTPKIRTLLIEPDLDRVTVVWVGETRLQLPATPKKLAELKHGVIWP